ncbi:MAG TPA: CDP-alcohol phosphatidyltransferase family protein [Terriglobales bacterium]|nr:CDP-alcohol phosphatidyltransferase family protein [Terriglobales bacterium]
MQVVVVVPETTSTADRAKLTRRICGVGLLARSLATAQRAGARDVLLIWPQSMLVQMAETVLGSSQLRKNGKVRLVPIKDFDPNSLSSWASLQDLLEDRFVWLPWNWVTYPRALAALPESEQSHTNWTVPAWVSKATVASEPSLAPQGRSLPEGIAVTSDESAEAAERFLVANSGKILDGIHTSFNRRLCRPIVRWLSHTRVTPNAVTFGGVMVSILSAMAFARGNYWSYVAGALLFFIAGLFDEMDGMLARIKFADSPFGTWLEGFADGLSYLLLFGGITIGLYRQYGSRELWVGAALLVGTVLSIAITSLQRKRATSADRPSEYLGTFYRKLEKDSSNWISRAVRHAQAFQKRGVAVHYVVIFTVLGGLPVLFYLATLGSHLTWTLALYFNHRFFKQATPNLPLREIQVSQEAS